MLETEKLQDGDNIFFYESKKYHNYSIDGSPRTVIMRL